MKLVILILLVLALAPVVHRFTLSFGAQKLEDYRDTGPAFDIQKHLAGPMLSEGVIFGPTGRVAVRFVADMNGDWSGDTGTLSEAFNYASGGTQDRKWFLTMGEEGNFTATADDIIGQAVGRQVGATVQLKYKLRLTEDAGGHVLDVTDWMYLMDNGTIMNRSEMRKFGIKVAELVATIRPVKD